MNRTTRYGHFHGRIYDGRIEHRTQRHVAAWALGAVIRTERGHTGRRWILTARAGHHGIVAAYTPILKRQTTPTERNMQRWSQQLNAEQADR